MRVAEEHALFGEAVEVRGAEQSVRAGEVAMFGVDAREATPVVGEEEEDVRTRFRGRGYGGEKQGEDGEEAHIQRAGLIGVGSKSDFCTQPAGTFSPRT